MWQAREHRGEDINRERDGGWGKYGLNTKPERQIQLSVEKVLGKSYEVAKKYTKYEVWLPICCELRLPKDSPKKAFAERLLPFYYPSTSSANPLLSIKQAPSPPISSPVAPLVPPSFFTFLSPMLPSINKSVKSSRDVGGLSLSPNKRRMLLEQVLLNGKADASLDPKKLQKAYYMLGHSDERANQIREIDKGRRFPKSKFLVFDEFSGLWRLNGAPTPSPTTSSPTSLPLAPKSILTRVSIEVANAISNSSCVQSEVSKHFSPSSPPLPKVELFHTFKLAFPTVTISPMEVSKLCTHLQPNEPEQVHPEKMLVALLGYAANHMDKPEERDKFEVGKGPKRGGR